MVKVLKLFKYSVGIYVSLWGLVGEVHAHWIDTSKQIIGVRVNNENVTINFNGSNTGTKYIQAIGNLIPTLVRERFIPKAASETISLTAMPKIAMVQGTYPFEKDFVIRQTFKRCFADWFSQLSENDQRELSRYLNTGEDAGTLGITVASFNRYITGSNCGRNIDIPGSSSLSADLHSKLDLYLDSKTTRWHRVDLSLVFTEAVAEEAFKTISKMAMVELQRRLELAITLWLANFKAYALPSSASEEVLEPVIRHLEQVKEMSPEEFTRDALTRLISPEDLRTAIEQGQFEQLRPIFQLLDTLLSGCTNNQGLVSSYLCSEQGLRGRFLWIELSYGSLGSFKFLSKNNY